jgi:hypothetical protein
MIESVDTSGFSPFCCHYFLFDVLFKALAAWLDWSSRKMRDEETPLTRTLSIMVLIILLFGDLRVSVPFFCDLGPNYQNSFSPSFKFILLVSS